MALQTIAPSLPVSFTAYRAIRKHPTVSMVRRLSIAPVVRGSWVLDAPDANERTIELATELLRLRQKYMTACMGGLYDYGYVGFEQFLDLDGKLILKPLLVDSVQAVVDEDGELAGIEVSANFVTTNQFLSESVFYTTL